MERSAQEDHDTEIHRPGDRFEHQSQELPVTGGAPVIADFGAAHVGEPGQQFTGDIMPNFHRAPEVILNMPWDSKVDIWSIGVMVGDSRLALRNGTLLTWTVLFCSPDMGSV